MEKKTCQRETGRLDVDAVLSLGPQSQAIKSDRSRYAVYRDFLSFLELPDRCLGKGPEFAIQGAGGIAEVGQLFLQEIDIEALISL